MFESYLDTGYWKRHVRKDYLVKGLYSTLLAPPTPELTLTMMIVPRGSEHVVEDVAPHNHAYDYQISVVSGTLHETRWTLSDGEEPFEKRYRYAYSNGCIISIPLTAYLYKNRPTFGSTFEGDRNVTHSVSVGKGFEPTVWVRSEFDRKNYATYVFSENPNLFAKGGGRGVPLAVESAAVSHEEVVGAVRVAFERCKARSAP